jgi:metallo-beta-lactamase class B
MPFALASPMRLVTALALLAAVGPGRAAPAGAQLTIRLTGVPASTPPGAAIHVAGTFNRWDPAAPGYTLAPQSDGAYAITLPDSVRGAVEFKFTLGSWQTVETSGGGGDVPNRAVTVPATGALTYAGTVAGWRDATVPRERPRSTASPSVSVLSDSFPMPQLGRTRRVWLYLPPDYRTSRRRYPVLYVHDGQNVFDAATSFAGEWGVDETLDSLRARGDVGAIVVAVDNGGSHRLDEYDPWRSADPKLGGGEGDAYVEFLVRTLKPYVDRHYRTRPDRRHTAVLGSSMGGLISLYAALKHPEVFGAAGVFSCACWVARPSLYAYARRAVWSVAHPAPRLYFVVGEHETADGQPARDQREVVDSLAAAGVPVERAVRALTREDGRHAEWFWRREFPAAYRWLFAGDGARAVPNAAAKRAPGPSER